MKKSVFFLVLVSMCLLFCAHLFGNDSIPEAPVFQDFENRRYQDSLFAVEEISDIRYANSPGFWSEIDDNTKPLKKILRVVDVRRTVPLDLCLDIFRPQNDTLKKRPLVMMIYGGAYYFGSKDDVKITALCRHFASMGYVVASIDHRLGFFPSKGGIVRCRMPMPPCAFWSHTMKTMALTLP